MAAKERGHSFLMHFIMIVISIICLLPLGAAGDRFLFLRE